MSDARRRWRAIPLRWRVIGLVTPVTILAYLARATLPVAAARCGMTNADRGGVALAFPPRGRSLASGVGEHERATTRRHLRRRPDRAGGVRRRRGAVASAARRVPPFSLIQKDR